MAHRRPRHCFDLACPALACGAGRRGRGRTMGEGSGRSIRPTRARSSAQRAQRPARHRRRSSRATHRRSRAGDRDPPPGGRPRPGRLVCPRRARDRRPRGGSTNCCSGAPQVRAAPESPRADDTRAAGGRSSRRTGSGLACRAAGPAGSGVAARPPSGRLQAGPRSLGRLLRPGGAAVNGAALARRRLAPQDALLGVASALAAFGLALVLAVTLARQPLPLGLVVLAGAALVGTLALAVVRTTPPSVSASRCSDRRCRPCTFGSRLRRRDRGRAVTDDSISHAFPGPCSWRSTSSPS